MSTFNGTSGDDTLTGGSGADSLLGKGGDDSLNGGAGDDTLTGSTGNDTLVTSSGSDLLNGGAGNDVYFFKGHFDTATIDDSGNLDTLNFSLMPAHGPLLTIDLSSNGDQDIIGTGSLIHINVGTVIENVIGSNQADDIIGNAAANSLSGGSGNDIFDDNSGGADTFAGGAGDDYFILRRSGITVTEAANKGIDTEEAHVTGLTLASNVENGILKVTGTLTGNSLNNMLEDQAANNTNVTLDGALGSDIYVFNSNDGGNDVIQETADSGITNGRDMIDLTHISAGAATVNLSTGLLTFAGTGDTITFNSNAIEDFKGTTVNDTITGGAEDNRLWGYSGTDSIVGGNGHDTIDGGQGNDTLEGGVGDDVYVFSGNSIAHDTITDTAGNNILDFSGYTESDGVDIDISSDNNNNFNQTLSNSLDVNGATSVFFEVIGSRNSDHITGDEANNSLIGGAGIDTLNGGGGNDTLVGGTGLDVYVFEDNFGTDTIVDTDTTTTNNLSFTSMTNAVTVNLANHQAASTGGLATWNSTMQVGAVFGGSGNDTFLGDSQDNSFSGSGGNDSLVTGSGNDVLNGGNGDDTLNGGIDNDTYVFNNSFGNDTLLDSGGIETLSMQTSNAVTVNLSQDLDLGTAGVQIATTAGGVLTVATLALAGAIENIISGSGDDILTGNALNNSITGGIGLDTLSGGAGNDTLNGSSDDDTLTGDAGNDTLDGGTGADLMNGGSGADHFFVDNAGDVVHESTGDSGTDLVTASVSFDASSSGSLGIENITLTGTALNITANDLNNVLIGNDQDNQILGGGGNDHLLGNDGNDTLTGGLGQDTMEGGLGNDSYSVDHDHDVIIEAANAGTDLVTVDPTLMTLTSLTLGAALENLTIVGSRDFDGIGNSLSNILTGNSGNNSLDGQAGNDTLTGGSGIDTLIGGAGNDSLSGGAHDDMLQGGADDDIYSYLKADGAFGNDIILDTGGTSDNLRMNNYVLTDVHDFTAIDTDGNGHFDALQINMVGDGTGHIDSLILMHYFDDSTGSLSDLAPGTGLIETLTFNFGVLDFDSLVSLIQSA